MHPDMRHDTLHDTRQPRQPARSSEDVRALLVEADGAPPLARELLGSSVGELTTTANLEVARACLARRPDLVVIDLDLDPTELTQMLCADPGTRAPAEVVISGAASAAQAFRLAQFGVRAFVAKPLTEPAIRAAVRSALEEPPDVIPQLRALVGFLPIHDIERLARRTLMQEALVRARGNKTGAAKLLHISRQLLQHMLRGQKRLS